MGNNINAGKAVLNYKRRAWGLEATAGASALLQGAAGVTSLSFANPEWFSRDFDHSPLASINRSKNVIALEMADAARPYHPADSLP